MKLKQNKVDANHGAHCTMGRFGIPGIGWPLQAPDWLTPHWMMQFGYNLQCCLRKQRQMCQWITFILAVYNNIICFINMVGRKRIEKRIEK